VTRFQPLINWILVFMESSLINELNGGDFHLQWYQEKYIRAQEFFCIWFDFDFLGQFECILLLEIRL